jgi:2-amino-4-hydroxy-6-hydroxymethyldihydropteridine diphosphokinase
MNKICLSIGTNLGDRTFNLNESIKSLKIELGNIELISSIYETEAWGVTNQPSYFNIALLIETLLDPFEALAITQKIENRLGRVREEKWGARIIDIDILFFNDDIINSEILIIPHPRLSERKFVLSPLEEILPNFKHPIFNETIINLNRICTDTLKAKKLNKITTVNE